jgi:hypothetical protein
MGGHMLFALRAELALGARHRGRSLTLRDQSLSTVQCVVRRWRQFTESAEAESSLPTATIIPLRFLRADSMRDRTCGRWHSRAPVRCAFRSRLSMLARHYAWLFESSLLFCRTARPSGPHAKDAWKGVHACRVGSLWSQSTSGAPASSSWGACRKYWSRASGVLMASEPASQARSPRAWSPAVKGRARGRAAVPDGSLS